MVAITNYLKAPYTNKVMCHLIERVDMQTLEFLYKYGIVSLTFPTDEPVLPIVTCAYVTLLHLQLLYSAR